MAQINIEDLPQELQDLLARTKEQGQRSPIAKPLTDLREPSDPKKRINRPTFFFEMGPDLPPYKHQEYPKVLWHQSGTDTVVLTREAEQAMGPDWGPLPPGTPPEVADVVKAELSTLTPEEQAMVFEAHRKARLDSLMRKFDGLTDKELDAIEAATLTKKPKKG